MLSHFVCAPLQDIAAAQEKLQRLAIGLTPPSGSRRSLRQAEEDPDPQSSSKLLRVSDAADRSSDIGSKLAVIDRKLERIAASLGIRGVSREGDEEEDRKRLKEKLKQAIEADRRSRMRTIFSTREVWLEYVFGICRPDQRMGKRGSRWPVFLFVY